MYFDKVFYNEKYEPQTIQLICNKCGEYIEVQCNNDYINNIKSEYCIVTNGSKIVCKCGNRCQSGLIEPKKISKPIQIHQQSHSSTSLNFNIPKCPTCQSTNVQKIGIGERAASVAVLGIFSKKINKSFKCKNCGCTW